METMDKEKTAKKKEWTAKRFLVGILIVQGVILVTVAILTIILDPFFHYHAPLDGFFYKLSDQRHQNNGITRHFDYDAVITGTSMVENFRASEFSDLFGTRTIKVPYPGATFKEVNDNLDVAFATHDEIRYVLRGLDYSHLVEDAQAIRTDMGEYPSYLYDDNPFNDVKYFYNRTMLSVYLAPMLRGYLSGTAGGVTDFDTYGSSAGDEYSAAVTLGDRESFQVDRAENSRLTEEEKVMLLENIRQNVTRTALDHPETEFLIFFTPYSAAWYGALLEKGGFGSQFEAERIAAQEMLACPNIRLFSFAAEPEITMDLSHYKDFGHYSPEISSLLLERIAAGENELTPENLDARLTAEEKLYRELDYDALIRQKNTP